MKHVKTHIDQYLRNELSAVDHRRVDTHLTECAECRKYADWISRLNRLAGEARIEPPQQVADQLRMRLLAIPEQMATGEITRQPLRRSQEKISALPSWISSPAPLLRVAAILLIGAVIGYGFRESIVTRQPVSLSTDTADAPKSARSGAAMEAASQESVISELQTRVSELESVLMITYFARVEAAMSHFVTSANKGELSPMPAGTAERLLSVTASLKADCKTMNDSRMVKLFGQIELVLMEIDHLNRERDLTGARQVATVIEEEGLLSTLQRLKVGLEE